LRRNRKGNGTKKIKERREEKRRRKKMKENKSKTIGKNRACRMNE
jgi:hypothetical protein